MIALDPPFATLFTRHLFNLPICESTEKTSFSPACVHIPSLHSFAVNNSDMESLKKEEIFKHHHIVLVKLAVGAHLFDNHQAGTDLYRLQVHVKSYILSISSNTQHVESKIKDVSLCKTTGRSEITTSCLHNTRSQLISDITKKTVSDVEYINRKKSPTKKRITICQAIISTKTCSSTANLTSACHALRQKSIISKTFSAKTHLTC